ncbi:alpha/beta fold hydrolase [Acidisoma cellulosilytica]|uniref:Alpha/beta fold hydrolase n=1 Tax=Acidisoma cellulosilyticum TaxID=2802395 RepID=A0A963YYG2_9PROT|nr:alpha/beta fold hydrolase [Acidisoma cellulosilyticum]MCB8879502.1 alpha/beta fold hydrolase [Acidisoma cellulosilyticum]
MPSVQVRGEEFHYEVSGSGPTLLLVTGLAGTASYWNPNIEALSQHYRVIRYDHRGTGASVRTEGAYSIEGLTEDLVGLLDALGEKRVLFLGHSTGGAIGQVLAARYPLMVERMVLYGSWATLCPQMALAMEMRLKLLKAYGPAMYHRASPVFLFPPRYLCEKWDEIEPALIRNAEQSTTASILEARVNAVTAFDGRAYLPEITCPTLVLVARDDNLTPLESAEELARGIEGAALQVLPYGAHAVSQCEPEIFNKAVMTFLAY